MNVVFRVDASTQMGIGHLMRCLALAEALRQCGVHVSFVCREHPGSLNALLGYKAIPVILLPIPSARQVGMAFSDDYAAWLGVTQLEDAEQTIEALNGERPDWLIVDHYGLDINWEKRLRPHVNKLMVIDDLANRLHDCDLLLDQNYSDVSEFRYAGLINDGCKLLLGPRFALLKPEYAAFRKTHCAHEGPVKCVFVFFGGSDLQDMTGMALDALSRADLRHLEVFVVVGINNLHRKSIERRVSQRSLTTLYENRPHLADLMVRADLAIGAGGTTTWERMCLGLPTIVVTIAENQRPASAALAKAKLVKYAGHSDTVTCDQLAQLLLGIIHNPVELRELGDKNQLQVDGLGVPRLIELIRSSDAETLSVRRAERSDLATYYNWANDPLVRKNAITTAPVAWAVHQAWFAKKLNDDNSLLFVLEAGELPVGQIRFDIVGDEAIIDYSLDEIVRSRGWGCRLIELGVDQIWRTRQLPLRADVKVENEASVSVFLKMGFTESPVPSSGRRTFYLNPSDCFAQVDRL